MGINRKTVHSYLCDPQRGIRLAKRPDRLSCLHAANQKRLIQAYESVGGNCTVLSVLLRDDPATYGLPEEFNLTDRSIRRFFLRNYRDLIHVPAPAYQTFHCEPGQQLQIDFTQARFRFAKDTEATKLYLFEAVYPWSHKAFVMVCPDMTQSSWLMGISSCLVRFGIPQEILCDNDKSLVIDHGFNKAPTFHPDFEWLCKPLGIQPRACRPSRPQTKGVVERFGRYLKQNGLAYLQAKNHLIPDIATLQHCLNDWLERFADKRIFGGKTVLELYEKERQFLNFCPDVSQYLDIDCYQTVSSSRAGIHAYGYRIALAPEQTRRAVTVVIRHNGEYRVSTPEGKPLCQGVIPMANLQRYKRDDRAAQQEEPRAGLDQFNPMSELYGLF